MDLTGNCKIMDKERTKLQPAIPLGNQSSLTVCRIKSKVADKLSHCPTTSNLRPCTVQAASRHCRGVYGHGMGSNCGMRYSLEIRIYTSRWQGIQQCGSSLWKAGCAGDMAHLPISKEVQYKQPFVICTVENATTNIDPSLQ